MASSPPDTPRDATAADIAAIVELWHQGWHDGHGGHVPQAFAEMRKLPEFQRRTHARLSRFRLLGGQGDSPLAGLTLIDGNQLDQFYLSRAARGTGAAQVLMNDALTILRRSGKDHAWLLCAQGNTRARRFYEKSGWHLASSEMADIETEHGPFKLAVWQFEISL